MELFTLSSRFLPRDSIGEFLSVIWTERYFAEGEVQLVVPATPKMMDTLAPGVFLGLRGTKEIMQIENQSVDKGLLTVTGKSLLDFLDQRHAWFKNDIYGSESGGDAKAAEYVEDAIPAGTFLSGVVYKTVINPVPFIGDWLSINLKWALDKINGLVLGHVDDNGTPKRMTFPLGPLGTGLKQVAQAEGLGLKMYLQSAKYSTGQYVMKFATYRGRDRTSDQSANGIVRLSPQLDSLTDVKEIQSAAEYKNYVYVNYKNTVYGFTLKELLLDIPYTADLEPHQFERRVLMVDAPDIFLFGDHIPAFTKQVARNAFLNHIYVQAVDGKVASKIAYEFGEDYYLGDVVELQGYSGFFSKARVIEYIRSQDQFGEQEYPTLAVLDPLETGYTADLEPDPPNPGDPDDPTHFDDDTNFDDDTADDAGGEEGETGYDVENDPDTGHSDSNPDPTPDFAAPPGGSSGDDDGDNPSPEPTDSNYVLVGYYPDQDNGEVIGYVTFSGDLRHAWHMPTEDPEADPDYSYIELIPMGWTQNHQKLIARSQEYKEETTAFPWSHAFAYWLLDPPTGETTKLSETLPTTGFTKTDELGQHRLKPPGVLWCGSDSSWHLYLVNDGTTPPEYVYADRTYSTDPTLTDHGDRYQTTGGPIELWSAWGGGSDGVATKAELQKILHVADFDPNFRWSSINGPYPSPDGTKLVFSRRMMGGDANWTLQSFGGATGGYFRLTIGATGNTVISYDSAALSAFADAEEIYDDLIGRIPYLVDPRTRGYPYTPYSQQSGTNVSNGQVRLIFDIVGVTGVWMSIENHIESDFGASDVSIGNTTFSEHGDEVWFICDYDGQNLEQIDFPGMYNVFGGWSPDSSKLTAVVPSADGAHHYTRWLNYDVSTEAKTYPLDASTEPMDSDGYGRLKWAPKYSPDGSKIAYLGQEDYSDPKRLFVANADGTDEVALYEDVSSPDQNNLVLSTRISWSFDNSMIAVVDQRSESPVFLVEVAEPHTVAQIWNGSGWTDSSQQKWIYDPQDFDG